MELYAEGEKMRWEVTVKARAEGFLKQKTSACYLCRQIATTEQATTPISAAPSPSTVSYNHERIKSFCLLKHFLFWSFQQY